MIKIFKQFLKDKGFKIDTASPNHVLSAYHIESKLVISYVDTNGTTIICKETSTDIRFNGKIHNLQQLKLILTLIS